MTTRRHLTPDQQAHIRARYPVETCFVIATALGVKPVTVRAWAWRNGIAKDRDALHAIRIEAGRKAAGVSHQRRAAARGVEALQQAWHAPASSAWRKGVR